MCLTHSLGNARWADTSISMGFILDVTLSGWLALWEVLELSTTLPRRGVSLHEANYGREGKGREGPPRRGVSLHEANYGVE